MDDNIKKLFEDCGYNLSFKLLNSSDYGVPQDRLRVFFIGIRKDFDFRFEFPPPFDEKVSLKDSIWDLRNSVLQSEEKNWTNGDKCKIPNHEYLTGGFSTIFMSRNNLEFSDLESFSNQTWIQFFHLTGLFAELLISWFGSCWNCTQLYRLLMECPDGSF